MNKEIIFFDSNSRLNGMARIDENIVYSEKTGQKLTLIHPWEMENDTRKYPLIVFVQGSGWTTPDLGYELPQLSQLAKKGYVVASVCHRDFSKGYPIPAFLEDVKTSIRFLRANAEKYKVDSERVAIWGTSSGGNAALLVALTGDSVEYKKEEYITYSDAVKFAISCFGPTDMREKLQEFSESDQLEKQKIIKGLCGERNVMEVAKEMSPLCRLKEGISYAPILLLHGDADTVVAYEQSEKMYHKLLELGQDVQLVCVRNSNHEGEFWSQELFDFIFSYIEERI